MKKFNEFCNKIIGEMTENTIEDTIENQNTEICKDWGYANMCYFDDDFAKKFKAAKKEHEQMVKDHPEEHDSELKESTIGTCLHRYSCKCGYSYKVDSSD